jgi:hypothetical protein
MLITSATKSCTVQRTATNLLGKNTSWPVVNHERFLPAQQCCSWCRKVSPIKWVPPSEALLLHKVVIGKPGVVRG